MKRLLWLVLILSMAAHGAGKRRPPAPEPSPTNPASVLPGPHAPIQLNLGPISGASDAEGITLYLVEQILADTVASPCFGTILLNRPMIQTNGRTREQVLSHIRSLKGRVPLEVYSPPWWKPTSAVGYTSPQDPLIHMNRKKVGSLCDQASLIAHEALGHKLGGYDHDFKATERRPYSVPYSINAAFEICCQ